LDGSPVITLTTDFGNKDGYTASVKGVILCINPSANIVDICNIIEPQNIYQASFVLKTVCRYFPDNTVHLVVVDPGVGTERKAIILQSKTAFYIAPDNGVLTYVVGEYFPGTVSRAKEKPYSLHNVRLPSGLNAFEITNPDYWLKNPSSTFHGRDILGPVAAYLSRGVAPASFGKALESINIFNIPVPSVNIDGNITGQVIHVDGFGNLITNINGQQIRGRQFTLEIAGKQIKGPGKTYAEKKGLNALTGSSGYLEIVLQNGNAATYLKAGFGSKIILMKS